mgnify:CR=1 FL=1
MKETTLILNLNKLETQINNIGNTTNQMMRFYSDILGNYNIKLIAFQNILAKAGIATTKEFEAECKLAHEQLVEEIKKAEEEKQKEAKQKETTTTTSTIAPLEETQPKI